MKIQTRWKNVKGIFIWNVFSLSPADNITVLSKQLRLIVNNKRQRPQFYQQGFRIPYYMKFSLKFSILNHFNFAFLSKTRFISLAIFTNQMPYISFRNDSLIVDIHIFKVKFIITSCWT